MYNDVFRTMALFIFRTIYAGASDLNDVYNEMLKYDLSNVSKDDKELFEIIMYNVNTCKVSIEKINELYEPNLDSTGKVVPIKRFRDTTEYDYKTLLRQYSESLNFLEKLHVSFASGFVNGIIDGMNHIK